MTKIQRDESYRREVFTICVCTQIRRDESFRKEINGQRSGSDCSKLTTSLVNVSLKFKTLMSQICQYFLLKNLRSFCKSFSNFFQQKISVFLVIKSQNT